SPAETFQIFVNNSPCKTTTYDCGKTTTVAQLKSMVEAKTGVPIRYQRLIYSGKQLFDDWRALDEYLIESKSTVHLLLRAGGGACSRCSNR
ncbi:hypothetical protein PENTCL1PPCAC_4586, partial [Pristionchus entomophagus]